MKNDNDQRLSIRPTLNLAIKPISELEKFQNFTLRPILKLQNELLVQIFKHYTVKRKIKFDNLISHDQFKLIDKTLKTDIKFRNYCIGCIIGHFTIDEYAAYTQHEPELNRRIVTMLTKRLQSQLIETPSDHNS